MKKKHVIESYRQAMVYRYDYAKQRARRGSDYSLNMSQNECVTMPQAFADGIKWYIYSTSVKSYQ